MCKECGCEDALHHHHHHDGEWHTHAHVGPDGKVYMHTHGTSPETGSHVVPLKQAILADNDHAAEENRNFFASRGIRVFNLISSPGSGKTTLLVKTLELLKENGISCAVIVGDQYGEIDAERIRVTGVPVTQIQVHDSCHLTAAQIAAVRETAIPGGTQILFIENVGNLVCPTAFDLGENEKVALLSTPEGEEKPQKYPALFSLAKFVLLTKCDLAEVIGWNRDECRSNVRKINPDARILEVSAKTGNGMSAWISYLKESI